MAKYIFAYNMRKRFWRMFFGRITKVTLVHHLTPKKKHTLMDQFLFQNSYCWFILEKFWASFTKSINLTICYFRALWTCQACLTTPKKIFIIKSQLSWTSYYMQKANFLPQIVFEILKFRKLCNLIGLGYFQLQLNN